MLDIALDLFSRQGIARTSLNAIAKEAGVTPAMLHYYFNSREQLLDAMIEERFLPLRSAIGALFSAHPGRSGNRPDVNGEKAGRSGRRTPLVRAAVDAGSDRGDAGAADASAGPVW
ncbi:Potential acrAB operon repressor [Leclercia adecarboxylata]|uniref:Potential acrAB operon repressor n=1 Tax=Leclercia adecarboxylata TaxID=83655 RepID=A0A4U9HDJ3_9ENTR|nr:Potential acrAB operon repressor [Leclercia adecarboxylata]